MKKRPRHKLLSVILAIVMVAALLPVAALAQEPTEHDINNDGPITITEPGTYIITGTGVATTNTITVAADVYADITLNNVHIDVSSTNNACAFLIADDSNGDVNITLVGENILKSGFYRAGLQKNGSGDDIGKLTIGGTGSLTATGGSNGAGIGGGGGDGSNITINDGSITANGGSKMGSGGAGGAGIGGGNNGTGSHITISGGTVTATGGNGYGVMDGAGIGGGNKGNGSHITIEGGMVRASGSSNAAGIGGGYGGNGNDITISGGTVVATGGSYGAGIGGGYGDSGSNGGHGSDITISGGMVTATGGTTGIGGGTNGSTENINISPAAGYQISVYVGTAAPGELYDTYTTTTSYMGTDKYFHSEEAPVPTEVELVSAAADGTEDVNTSNRIDLEFDKAVTGLTGDHITITDGSGSAEKGALSGSDTQWSIALTSVITQGDVSVAVSSPEGYTITGSPKTVAVYQAASGTAPTITTTFLPGGTVGTSYSQTLAADGDMPITWSMDSGSLPDDLSLSVEGVISGTPTAEGTFNFIIKATNAAGDDTKALSIEINPAATPESATISPVTAVFDLDNSSDIDTVITWNDANTVTGVVYGSYILESPKDFSVVGNTLTITEEFLSGLNLSDGDTVVLTISFDLGASATLTIEAKQEHISGTDASLSGLTVGGSTVSGFAADTFICNVELPYGTQPGSPAATVCATPADSKASVSITQATTLPGSATVEVTAEDGTTEQTYTINFTLEAAPTTYTVTYNGSGNTGGTVPVDSNTYTSGSTVTVLGNTGSLTRSGYSFAGWSFSSANYAPGDTFTIAENIMLYARWTSIGSSGGSSGGASSTAAPSPTLTPAENNAKITGGSADGTTLAVEVHYETGNAAIDLGTLAEEVFGDDEAAVITVPSITKVSSYTLELPASALSVAQGEGSLTFSTGKGSITIAGNMLAGIDGGRGKSAAITISTGDKDLLPAEVKAAIGNRPLLQFTLTLDGEQVDWSNPAAPVTVSIPYTPTSAELADPEHIVVWYIDGSGNVVCIPNGRYNAETGTVTFSTTHFSCYAVAYVHKNFADLGSVEWAVKSIEVMASKGIINGTSATTYSPAANITRADFLILLVKTLGLTANFNAARDGNFADVEPGTYYYETIGIAKKLGLASGVGDNRFNPRKHISRQDMMALTASALEKSKGLAATEGSGVLDKFNDKDDVAGYAVTSLATLVDEGLIAGNGNNLNPRRQTTRAEAAVFLHRIYNKY